MERDFNLFNQNYSMFWENPGVDIELLNITILLNLVIHTWKTLWTLEGMNRADNLWAMAQQQSVVGCCCGQLGVICCSVCRGLAPDRAGGSGAAELSARGTRTTPQQRRLEMFYHRKLFYYATQFLGTASPPQPPPCHWATLAQKDVHKLQTITTTVRTQEPPPAPRHKVLLLRCDKRMGKSRFLKATNIVWKSYKLLASLLQNSLLRSNINVYR